MGRVFSIMFFQPNYWGFHAGEKKLGNIFPIIIFSTVNYSGSRESWDPKFVPFCNEQKSLQILVKHIYNVRKSVPAACFTFNFCLGAPAARHFLISPALGAPAARYSLHFPPLVRLWHDIPFIFRPSLKKIQQMQNPTVFFST